MGRKRGVATVGEVEADIERLEKALKRRKELEVELAGESPLNDAELPGASRIDAIIDELAGDGSFSIFRLENGGQTKCGSYDLPAWPSAMEATLKKLGGGDYLITFHRKDGTLATRISRTYDKTSYPGAGEPVGPRGESEMVLKFFEMQDRRDQAHRAELAEMRIEMARVQENSTKILIETIKSTSKPLVSSLQDITSIANLFNGKKTDPLDEYFKVKDMLDELREDDGPSITESPMAAVLDRVAKALLPALTKIPEPKAPEPAAVPTAALPNTPRPEPQPVKVQVPTIAPFVDSLVRAVEGGDVPGESAEIVYHSVVGVPENCEAVKKLVEGGDWSLAYEHPFLCQHKKWLDDFRDALKAKFSTPAA